MLQADVTSHQSGQEGCLASLHQPLLSQPRGTFCSLVLGSIQRNKNTFYCCTPCKKQVGESNAQNCCHSGGLLVYQSWVLEEKKKHDTKSSASCPSHSDGDYCVQCIEAFKNRERRQKVVLLNRDEHALEWEQLGEKRWRIVQDKCRKTEGIQVRHLPVKARKGP